MTCARHLLHLSNIWYVHKPQMLCQGVSVFAVLSKGPPLFSGFLLRVRCTAQKQPKFDDYMDNEHASKRQQIYVLSKQFS